MEHQKQDNQFDIQPIPDAVHQQPTRLYEIFGNFRTSSLAPTILPTKVGDQIVLYKSGATKRLYVADLKNGTWSYVALT